MGTTVHAFLTHEHICWEVVLPCLECRYPETRGNSRACHACLWTTSSPRPTPAESTQLRGSPCTSRYPPALLASPSYSPLPRPWGSPLPPCPPAPPPAPSLRPSSPASSTWALPWPRRFPPPRRPSCSGRTSRGQSTRRSWRWVVGVVFGSVATRQRWPRGPDVGPSPTVCPRAAGRRPGSTPWTSSCRRSRTSSCRGEAGRRRRCTTRDRWDGGGGQGAYGA